MKVLIIVCLLVICLLSGCSGYTLSLSRNMIAYNECLEVNQNTPEKCETLRKICEDKINKIRVEDEEVSRLLQEWEQQR